MGSDGERRFGSIVGVLGGAAFLPALFFAISSAPSCMSFEAPTIRALEACPLAVSMLGASIERAPIGMSCGNAETGDAEGNASWRFPVRGSRGEGYVELDAIERGSVWHFQRLHLTVGDRAIDALTCGPIVTAAAIRPARFEGQVVSTVGSPGVAMNDACSIVVQRGDGAYPCRVQVRCGSRVIYGAGSTGWTQCGPDRHGSFTIRDVDDTAAGGDPTLDLRAAAGEAILTDQTAGGTWVVSIRFPPAP